MQAQEYICSNFLNGLDISETHKNLNISQYITYVPQVKALDVKMMNLLTFLPYENVRLPVTFLVMKGSKFPSSNSRPNLKGIDPRRIDLYLNFATQSSIQFLSDFIWETLIQDLSRSLKIRTLNLHHS